MSLYRGMLAGAASLNFAARVLALNPWGYWKLDETGTYSSGVTVATDYSGNNRHGTYFGTLPSSVTLGNAGLVLGSSKSINLTGSGRVSLPTFATTNTLAITVISIIKTTTTSLVSIIGADGTTGTRQWQFRISSGNLQVITFVPGTVTHAVPAGSSVNDGSVHMVGFVLDPSATDGRVKIYRDGVVVYASPIASNYTLVNANTAHPGIGTRSGAQLNEGYIGDIDEGIIVLSALTPAQMLDLWNNRNIS